MSGSSWLIAAKGKDAVSELGEDVADLLGELFFGIYHIHPEVMRADFSNPTWIEVLVYKSLATWDFNELTRLVFLAHHMAIRVDVSAARNGILRLMFHRRERDGSVYIGRHMLIDYQQGRPACALLLDQPSLKPGNAEPFQDRHAPAIAEG